MLMFVMWCTWLRQCFGGCCDKHCLFDVDIGVLVINTREADEDVEQNEGAG